MMKFAVRYYTRTGNTKRLAEAMAAVLGVFRKMGKRAEKPHQYVYAAYGRARLLTAEELAVANANVRQEEIAFRSAFEAALKALPNYAEIKEIIS